MKKIVVLMGLFCTIGCKEQIHDPVKWTTSVVKVAENEYDLLAKAVIEDGWHLYSQTLVADGPISTRFIFEEKGAYFKRGNTKEENGKIKHDKVFGVKIKCFENRTIFKQRIQIKSKYVKKLRCRVVFAVCDDAKCLPAKSAELIFKLK